MLGSMSKQYTADGRRRSSMTHAQRSWTCPCGRKVWGNGGKSSHQRACAVWAESNLAMLERILAMIDAGEMSSINRWKYEQERDEMRGRLSA